MILEVTLIIRSLTEPTEWLNNKLLVFLGFAKQHICTSGTEQLFMDIVLINVLVLQFVTE